jgi:hypothetical protein
MTKQRRLPQKVAAGVGLAGIVTMGVLTASCSKQEEKAPETSTTTTTTTTTTPPPASPTENAPRLDPNAPNPFSPTVVAPGPPTAQPGQEGRHQTFN